MSEPDSLPEDPRLAEIARELARARWAAEIYDADWKMVWVSDDLKELVGESDNEKIGYGRHLIDLRLRPPWITAITPEAQPEIMAGDLELVIPDTAAGPSALYAIYQRVGAELGLDPSGMDGVRTVVEGLEAAEAPLVRSSVFDTVQTEGPAIATTRISIRLAGSDGGLLGTIFLYLSSLRASVQALLSRGDAEMYERMVRLAEPGRKQAAILFADLQASGTLSRRLPSAGYFSLIRALTTAIDQAVVDRTGIVGKHAGDGVTAFFLAGDLGSSSGAARAAIEAARGIREAAARVASGHGADSAAIGPEDCLMNIGVHWGGALYMGQLVTGGRLEVTALGDEVNECARIQQAARDGELLASKNLIERLEPADAGPLDLDPDAVRYRTVGELPGAGEKAIRDAGGVAVTAL